MDKLRTIREQKKPRPKDAPLKNSLNWCDKMIHWTVPWLPWDTNKPGSFTKHTFLIHKSVRALILLSAVHFHGHYRRPMELFLLLHHRKTHNNNTRVLGASAANTGAKSTANWWMPIADRNQNYNNAFLIGILITYRVTKMIHGNPRRSSPLRNVANGDTLVSNGY